MFRQKQYDFSEFIGKEWETEVTEEQLTKFCNASMVRVLGPTSPMTMDLRPNRVNVIIEEDKTIMMINMG